MNYLINKHKERRALYYMLALLVCIQIFITLLTNGFALSQDEAMWHYIGRNWFRNGLVPYTGGADNKSPLYYAIYGVSDWLFGVNYWFPRLLGTFCQTIGVYFVYKIARKMASERTALLAVSFYGLSTMWHGADGRYVSFTETYQVTFSIIAFYFFITNKANKHLWISGLCCAIAIAFRLSGVFDAAAFLLLSGQKGLKTFINFLLGLLAGVGILAIATWRAGIRFHDIYFYAFADNFGKGSTSDHSFLWRCEQFFSMFCYSELILFYPLVMLYLFAKKKLDWILLWLLFDFLGINVVGNYARVDMKEILPSISLIAAFAIGPYVEDNFIFFNRAIIIIWVCFSPRLLEPFVNFKHLFAGEFQKAENYCHAPFVIPDESASRQLGQWLKANTQPKQTIYVAGYGAQVQAYSERLSPTIYFNVTQTQIAKQQTYKDLTQHAPDYLLIPRFEEYERYVDADLRSFIDSLAAKKYRQVTCMFNYELYSLKR